MQAELGSLNPSRAAIYKRRPTCWRASMETELPLGVTLLYPGCTGWARDLLRRHIHAAKETYVKACVEPDKLASPIQSWVCWNVSPRQVLGSLRHALEIAALLHAVQSGSWMLHGAETTRRVPYSWHVVSSISLNCCHACCHTGQVRVISFRGSQREKVAKYTKDTSTTRVVPRDVFWCNEQPRATIPSSTPRACHVIASFWCHDSHAPWQPRHGSLVSAIPRPTSAQPATAEQTRYAWTLWHFPPWQRPTVDAATATLWVARQKKKSWRASRRRFLDAQSRRWRRRRWRHRWA